MLTPVVQYALHVPCRVSSFTNSTNYVLTVSSNTLQLAQDIVEKKFKVYMKHVLFHANVIGLQCKQAEHVKYAKHVLYNC